MQGLIGRKIGMTRLFNPSSGEVEAATVVQTGMNVVHQIKTVERDGYSAAQLGFDVIEERKLNRPTIGHFKKLNTEPSAVLREVAIDSDPASVTTGMKIGLEIFETVRFVDVIGTTKGRGYTGTIKRYHFKR
ncbi:MAG: 50S ribosomal protein L3, partial [Chitinivibrionales bacterium]|nr:50S ribosomal protein L3 [Chitinivibrionales bacterium]